MCNISNRPLSVPADNLFKLTMEELLKERNAKMSQCIMLQNKNGVVMASDSALTEIDNNVFKLLTKIHPKVFSGPNFIWTFAGVVAFEKDIEKELNNFNIPMDARIDRIHINMKEVLKNYNQLYPFNFLLIVSEFVNEIITSYLYIIDNNGWNCMKSERLPIVTPIGLYSSDILEKHLVSQIPDYFLQEIIDLAVINIKECIARDGKINSGLMVAGEVYVYAMDNFGNITSYINGKEAKF